MAESRITQNILEVVMVPDSEARITQVVVETVIASAAYLGDKVTQTVIEYVITNTGNNAARRRQAIVAG